MPANFVALSDLHLGYELSVLNDPAAQNRVVEELADLCSGKTDRLILNGDIFEGCVPSDAGTCDPAGFSPRVAQVSRSFFQKIADKIEVASLVFVWGNHDYTMWRHLATSCKTRTFTNDVREDFLVRRDGGNARGSEAFLSDVIGPAHAKFARIRSAYPNYILGHGWPYLVFHHGHFLDDLVIGRETEAKYLGLKILTGQERPAVDIDGEETVISIHAKTEAFVAALWEYDSRARELEWAIFRRGEIDDRLTCLNYPQAQETHREITSLETFYDDLGRNAEWYTSVLTADPTTPPPIGPSTMPSYLFVGHDHLGGDKVLPGMDGKSWRVVNTGGWTSDGKHGSLHCHTVVWYPNDDAPKVYCLKV